MAPVTPADDAVVQKASVTPKHAYTDSVDGVSIEFKVSGSTPAEVGISISGSGNEVRRIDLPARAAGIDKTVRWDGLTNGGRPVGDGNYRISVGIAGGGEKEAGVVTLHRHFFPVRGPHGTRGAVGQFGAPRNGGRVHKGFDVTASCETPWPPPSPGLW